MEFQLQPSPLMRSARRVYEWGTEDTWTPAISFLTPGDLSVTYSRQQGRFLQLGSLAFCYFLIETSAFTHSTAIGNLIITGLPFKISYFSNVSFCSGNLNWRGITKAGYTDIHPSPAALATYFGLLMSGTGVATSAVSATDVPTGGTIRFEGTVTFFIGEGDAPFLIDSADLDGTNDYMTRGAGLTGAADSKTGIFSAWVRLDGGNAAEQILLGLPTTLGGNINRVRIRRFSDNKFEFLMANAAGTTLVEYETVATYTSSSTWIHVLSSWNTAAAFSAQYLYINDVSDITQLAVMTDDNIDYTTADAAVGARASGTEKLNGCLAEVYFAPGQYLDFSIESNRRKFISATGKPIFLGTDGSLPTGTAPIIYTHVSDGESIANFAINRGTGGNFTITGTLDIGSTSPSD